MVRDSIRLVLDEVEQALLAVDEEETDRFVTAVVSAPKVFVVGVGRVLLSLEAFAKRLNHLGVPAWVVGDTNEPAAEAGDLLIVGSGSGASVVPRAIVEVAKEQGLRIAHIGSNPTSALAPYTDIFVRIPVRTRLELPGEIPSAQPMTTLFEQALLLFCDAVCLEIVHMRGIALSGLRAHHATLE